jgi:putative transposase
MTRQLSAIGRWIDLYNRVRPHSSLDDRTPIEAYRGLPPDFDS